MSQNVLFHGNVFWWAAFFFILIWGGKFTLGNEEGLTSAEKMEVRQCVDRGLEWLAAP